MKMAKRIFIGVLVVAVMASCLVFAGTAATKEYTADNYSEILEYYESPVMFGYDFEDATVGETFTENVVNLGKGKQTVTVEEDANGKFLQFKGSNSNAQCGNVFFNWNGEEAIDNFFLDFVFSSSASAVQVSVLDTEDSDGAVFGAKDEYVMLNFKLSSGTLVYCDADGVETEVEGLTLAKNTVYTVSVKYTGSKGTYDFTVTPDGDEASAVTVTGVSAPYGAVQNVKLGCTKANIRNGVLAISDISAYAGSFKRNPNDIQPETEAAVIAMQDIFDDLTTPYEDKAEIATIIIKLKSVYGFESGAYVASLAYDDLTVKSILLYADELQNCIDAINTSASYADRLANVEAYAEYAQLMPVNCLFYVDTAVSQNVRANLEKYEEELAALADIKYNSDSFIAAVSEIDLEEVNYDVMTAWYENVSQYEPYEKYENMPEAQEKFDEFYEKYSNLNYVGSSFINNTAVFVNTENSFGERYEAFVIATENLYEEEGYPGIDSYHLSDVAYADARAAYEAMAEDMHEDIDFCETFIANVSSADYALYIVAKENFLIAAEEVMDDIQAEYPGIEDALALYDELIEDIAEEKQAAADYIAAVEATDGLAGTELVDAVQNALILQVKGNIAGVEGVTDANIKLSNLVVSTELDYGYSTQLVSLVSKIDDAKSLSERYELIVQALAIVDKAVDDYDGVTEAKAALAVAVEEYEATVKAINAAFVSANSSAVEISFGCN